MAIKRPVVEPQAELERMVEELLDRLRYNIKLYGGHSDERTAMMRRQYAAILKLTVDMKAPASIEMVIDDSEMFERILAEAALKTAQGTINEAT